MKVSTLVLLMSLFPAPASAFSLIQFLLSILGIDLSSMACNMLNDRLQVSAGSGKVDCQCEATVGFFSGIAVENKCQVPDVCVDQNSEFFCGSCSATMKGAVGILSLGSLAAKGYGVCTLTAPSGTKSNGIAVNMTGGINAGALELSTCDAAVMGSAAAMGTCSCSTASCSGYQISMDCSSVDIGGGEVGPSTNGCIGFPSFELA